MWHHRTPGSICPHPSTSAGISRHPLAARGESGTVEAQYIFYMIILTSSAGSRRHPLASVGIRRTPADANGRRPAYLASEIIFLSTERITVYP
jgi:hypothetical protein